MSLLLDNDVKDKIVFNDVEQELFDALLDEYLDAFENILNYNEKNLFDNIMNNVKAILGEVKMNTYSKVTIAKVLSALKIRNYMPDYLSIKNIKEMMASLGSKDKNKKIPEAQIDDIYAHCKDCSKCYHICGEVLLRPQKYNYLICLKCHMIYKKEMIHLYCKECKEEYYSYIVDENEPDYEDYFPATWDKYHCPNFIYEEMTCPKCENMLYYNDKKKLLKCFDCKWKSKLKNMKWTCEVCDAEFTSSVREYFKFETKPLVNCLRNALVDKIPARPYECLCCGAEPRLYIFKHNDNKGCKGDLYLGYLQKKEMVICANCRLVQKIKEVNWECPKCGEKFFCKKSKGNKLSANNYMLKPQNYINENTLKYSESKRRIDKEILDISTRGKSFEKKVSSEINEQSQIHDNNNKGIYELNGSDNKLDNKKWKNNGEKNNDNELMGTRPRNYTATGYLRSINGVSPNLIYKNDFSINEEEELNNLKNITTPLSKYILLKKKNNINNKSKIGSSSRDLSLNEKRFHLFNNVGRKRADTQHNRQYSLKGSNFSSKFMQNPKMIYFNKQILNSSIKNGDGIAKKGKSDRLVNLDLKLNIHTNGFTSGSNGNSPTSKHINTLGNDSKYNNIIEPDEYFVPEDFKIIKRIGEGTFGKIYCSEWIKNNKKYAMKKMVLRKMEDIKVNQEKTDLLFNFIKKTNSNGVIKVYGAQCEKKNESEFNYYVLMELAEVDWENEIKSRSEKKQNYTEGELLQILKQLVRTFALLQKNNITHRDVKPQNILKVNGTYKVCDFGEAKIIAGDGTIHQTIRGTELYMSPILFHALNSRQTHIVHNTYKSDVFSLGMCLFLAATLTFHSLYDIRELKSMDKIKNILVKYLVVKYSYNFVDILLKMLEVNEEYRPDFIQLDDIIKE